MKEDTPQPIYNSNPLMAIVTVIIVGLSLLLARVTDWVKTEHLLIGVLMVASAVNGAACFLSGQKFEKLYRQFISYVRLQGDERELTNELEETKAKLRDVSWLKRKEEFQEFEASSETDEVWVLTFNFTYELEDFRNIVVENLKAGKRYAYIYPQDARCHLFHFRGILEEAGIPREVVDKQIDFYELDKKIVPLNEAIYNPRGGKGRPIRAIVMTPELQFEYYIELNMDQTGRMIEKFHSLMKDAKRVNLSQLLAQDA